MNISRKVRKGIRKEHTSPFANFAPNLLRSLREPFIEVEA